MAEKSTPDRLVQGRMQRCLDRLGIPLEVCWTPDSEKDKQGEIVLSSKTLFIYSPSESEAWQTLIHEILEFKLKGVTSHYRNVINGLIEIIEKSCYQEKEEFLEFIPQVFEEVRKFEQKT
jgi:hypothetical protein